MALVIGTVEFDEDRVTISFVDDQQDLRNEGLVMQTHQLSVQRSPAYTDEIDALHDAAQELLADALDDFRNTDAVTPTPPADLEDDNDD